MEIKLAIQSDRVQIKYVEDGKAWVFQGAWCDKLIESVNPIETTIDIVKLTKALDILGYRLEKK